MVDIEIIQKALPAPQSNISGQAAVYAEPPAGVPGAGAVPHLGLPALSLPKLPAEPQARRAALLLLHRQPTAGQRQGDIAQDGVLQ